MNYQELTILLPCHSLEDFPTYHEGDNAESLLAAWTALWHPRLIASAGSKPNWYRADCPPDDLTRRLIVAPAVSHSQIPNGFAQRAKDAEAVLIRKPIKRDEILAAALAPLGEASATIDAELVADFLALGYCFLQVQLLTRQMRYASNLDEIYFGSEVVAAAQAAVAGDAVTAKEKLTSCFTLLAQEKDHYYPVDAFVLDLTLVAPTTIGASLRTELSDGLPRNFLISGETLATIAEREPATLAALRQAIEAGTANVVGGEFAERRVPLFGRETILDELRRGLATYEQHLGKRPTVFGRRRFGLGTTLPSILRRLDFSGAIHSTLDDGVFPQGSQAKTTWDGVDGTTIDALAKPPLDTSKSQVFLSWGIKLGETMDSDHVATLFVAHWPSQAATWASDLLRISRYTTALGKFTTLEKYFAETDHAGLVDRFEANQYLSPYLKQAIIRRQADPISTAVRYWRRRGVAETTATLNALRDLIVRTPLPSTVNRLAEVDRTADDPAEDTLDATLAAELSVAAGRLAEILPAANAASNAAGGNVVFNTLPFARRVGVVLNNARQEIAVAAPVICAAAAGEQQHVVVDLPPMGFAWMGSTPGGAAPAKTRGSRPVPNVAEDNILRNEFFELLIDPVTGALRSIHEYGVRGNRMSQQLAARLPGEAGAAGDTWRDPDETASYSVMAADDLRITANSSAMGEIAVRGRLLDRTGQELAKYEQRFQLWRGSRVIGLDIHLEPIAELRADPWNSYFACRFAWSDEAADLWRTVNQSRHSVGTRKVEAPQYLEIESGEKRTTILTGGVPFHRRVGMRMLDSLLVVRGERARRFQMGIGIDLPNPLVEAMSLMTPAPVVPRTIATKNASSWLFHIDTKNVITTALEPLVDASQGGRVVGFRARLLETAGRPTRGKLSAFCPVTLARQVDFLGQSLGDCQVEDGRVRFDLSSHEWLEIEARF